MIKPFVYSTRAAIGVVAMVAATACASPQAATPGTSPAAAPTRNADVTSGPSVLLTPQPTVTPRPLATETDIRAASLMAQMWDYERGFNLEAVRKAGELGHTGLIPPLVEVAGFTFDEPSQTAVGLALLKLTGESYGGSPDSVADWYRWLGRHPEVAAVEGYDGWKGHIYGSIAPGLDEFLYDGVRARVPTWAVQWGGVAKDGIRPLEDPPVIPGEEAGYLDPDEIVLGLVVNGEARAYPKRILNVHELANDVVGGKPVAVIL